MYVCRRVCLYVCMFVCMYVCIHVCIYIYMYVFTRTCSRSYFLRRVLTFISNRECSKWSGHRGLGKISPNIWIIVRIWLDFRFWQAFHDRLRNIVRLWMKTMDFLLPEWCRPEEGREMWVVWINLKSCFWQHYCQRMTDTRACTYRCTNTHTCMHAHTHAITHTCTDMAHTHTCTHTHITRLSWISIEEIRMIFQQICE